MVYLTLGQNDLRRIAAPFLRHLGEQCLETIHLAVLDDTDVVFMYIIESPQRVKLAAALGQRLPAFATASGKAILAYTSEDKVRQILQRGMPQYTETTLRSTEAFFNDLRHIREQGFAISEHEYEEGINAVAAPIFDSDGQPVASVAIAGPAYRLNHELMLGIGLTVLATSQQISKELKFTTLP